MWRRIIARLESGVTAGERGLSADSVAIDHNGVKLRTVRPFESIPGPKPLPLIANKWRYLPVIGEYSLERMDRNGEYNLRKYGKLVREAIQRDHTIVHVFDPKHMESVFRQEGKHPYRRSHRALLKYRRERPELYNSGGLFPENGEEWYRVRRMCQQTFLNQSNVNKYIIDFQRIAQDFVQFITATRDSGGEVVDIQRDLFKWALENTGFLALDVRLDCLNTNLAPDSDAMKLIKAGHDTQEAVMRTELTNSWEKHDTKDYQLLVTAQDIMATIVDNYIQRKILELNEQNGKIDKSLLAQLLNQKDVDYKDVFALIVDVFLAGIDTTAFSCGFALYYLARNLDAQEKLRREIAGVLNEKDEELSFAKISRMPYLKACVKETMRLRPVSIGVGRLTTQNVVIGDYSVPSGTMIITQNQVSCRQSEYFDDPDSFVPERWLKSHSRPKPSPFLVLPFGYGPRMCIGRRFSEMEIYVLLATVLQRFRVEYNGEVVGVRTRLINIPDKAMRFRFVHL